MRASSRLGARAERRVRLYYRLRGYRILAVNVWSGRNELDIVARRGDRLVFCEVKARSGHSFGDPLEAVGPEKQRRVMRAAEAYLARNPALLGLEVALEAAAVRGFRVERAPIR